MRSAVILVAERTNTHWGQVVQGFYQKGGYEMWGAAGQHCGLSASYSAL